MAIFVLTPEQQAEVEDILHEAEKREGNGTVVAQIYVNVDKMVVCQAHYLDEERSLKVQKILNP